MHLGSRNTGLSTSNCEASLKSFGQYPSLTDAVRKTLIPLMTTSLALVSPSLGVICSLIGVSAREVEIARIQCTGCAVRLLSSSHHSQTKQKRSAWWIPTHLCWYGAQGTTLQLSRKTCVRFLVADVLFCGLLFWGWDQCGLIRGFLRFADISWICLAPRIRGLNIRAGEQGRGRPTSEKSPRKADFSSRCPAAPRNPPSHDHSGPTSNISFTRGLFHIGRVTLCVPVPFNGHCRPHNSTPSARHKPQVCFSFSQRKSNPPWWNKVEPLLSGESKTNGRSRLKNMAFVEKSSPGLSWSYIPS